MLAIWRAVVREIWLPYSLAILLLVVETSLFAEANDWLGILSANYDLPMTLHLPVKAALVALILATVKSFATRRRQRLVLSGAIATELLASSHLASQSVDFDALRAAFADSAAERPIAVAASRPYLFISSDQESLVELPDELIEPLVRMLELEHALSLAWAKFDSESFLAASVVRRERYIGLVEGLWRQYDDQARPAVFRMVFYCVIRRKFPL